MMRSGDMQFQRRPLCLVYFIAVFMMSSIAWSQTLPNTTAADQLGELPYVSYHAGDIDAVSLTNGDLSMHAPVVSYPQRGSLQVSFSIRYNNMYQHYGPLCAAPDPCELDWALNTPAPVREKSDVFVALDQALGVWFSQPYPHTWKVGSQTYSNNYADYYVTDPDGSKHVLGNLGAAQLQKWPSGNSPNSYLVSSGPFETLDATGIKVIGALAPISALSGNPVIVTPDGTRQTSSSIQDPNGNTISLSNAVVDSMGRSISYPPTQGSSSNTSTASCPAGPLSVTKAVSWTIPSTNGNNATYIFCYVTVVPNMPTTMTLSNQTVYGPIGSSTNLQSIVLPNGLSWKFEYNDQDATLTNNGSPVTYGTLSKVTLPTGGSISYTWINAGSSLAANNPTFCNTGGRWIATRTLTDLDGVAHTWRYAYRVAIGSGSGTVVTDPLGNDTAHVFSLASGCSSYETKALYYQGSYTSGTLLRTVNTAYTSTSTGNTFPNGFLNVVPSTITTIEANNQTTQTTKGYDSGFAYTDHFGNGGVSGIYGRVTSTQVYDYGSGSPGSLLRSTIIAYAWQGLSANYLTNNLLNLPYSVQITDGGGTQRAFTYYGYDESGLQPSSVTQQKVVGESYPGNQTSVHRWLNGSTVAQAPCSVSVSNGYLVSSRVYYDTGEVQQSSDPCSYPTTYQYSSAYYGTFLTTATNALNQSTNFGYDFNTGVLTSAQDPNSQTTTKSYDVMARLTSIGFPDGGWTTICYTDIGGSTCSPSGPPYQMVKTTGMNGSQKEVTTAVFDGLGRLSQTQLNSDSPSTTYTLTTYDAMGRKSLQYNPTRCSAITANCGESTWGYSSTNYDALGRVTSVVEQDSSVVTTNYSAFPCTTVTDETNRSRKSCVDGLGRMTGVWEDPSGLNYETDYTYDALGNLTYVNQKGSNSGTARTRTFQYDSLSRLTSSQNPESGTITYAYDADANVITKTAPVPNQTGTATFNTTHTYDTLNRVTSTSYTDQVTPSNYYAYDVPPSWASSLKNPVGRLVNSANAYGGLSGSIATATAYSYDAMGRVVWEWEQTPSMAPGGYVIQSAYDLAGNLTSITNAAGTLLSYGYNGASRLATITSSLNDAQHPATLYSVDSSVGYWPTGGLRKALFGNGLTDTEVFNSRLQPCRMNTNSAGAILSNCSDSAPGGNLLDFTAGYNSGGADNGNIVSWSGTGNQTFNRRYGYDSLNRIQSMSDSASNQPCQGMSWTVDAWGNMSAQTGTRGTCYNFSSTVGTNNQLQSGYQYDAAGNMTYDGSHYYKYDGENRIIQVDNGSTASYVYNENGQRVRKNTGSSWTEYYYGPNGDVDSEYSGGSWAVEYVYSGSQLVAEYANNTTEFIHTDHLGSTRMITPVPLVDVRFTNDSCSGCSGNPVGGGDRNLYINSITIGSTAIYPNNPSVSYVSPPCNSYSNGVGTLLCTGDLLLPSVSVTSAATITVSAYGSPDYNIYPHMQLLLNGAVIGEWDVTGAAQNYTVNITPQMLATDNMDYLPFGQQIAGDTGTTHKFTGKERDSETASVPGGLDGLDSFGARYYGSRLGRFMTPDWDAKPVTVPYAKFGDPQTLNLYSYVENGPLNRIDPDGHEDEGGPSAATVQATGSPTPGSTVSGAQAPADGQGKTTTQPPAQKTTDGKTIAKGVGKVTLGVVLAGASILGAPETGGGSLAALTVAAGLLGSTAAAGSGIVDIAHGSGAVDSETAEQATRGIEIANNPVAANALMVTNPKTAENIGNVAQGLMGVREFSKLPEGAAGIRGYAEAAEKANAARHIYNASESAKELFHQVVDFVKSGPIIPIY